MPSEMRPVQRYFEDLGYQTEAPLLAGHGGDHHDLIATQWIDWVASAREALENLLTRTDKVVIMGLSMGGTIGALLAHEKGDKVAGVVMLSPTLCYDGSNLDNLFHQKFLKSQFLRDVCHFFVATVPLVGERCYWTETPPYGLKDERLQAKITRSVEEAKAGGNTKFGLFRTYFASLHQMKLLTDKFRSIAADITSPALVIHSFEDTLASFANATNTFQILGSTDKRLVGLTGCDHVMTLDLKRDQVCELAGAFTKRICGQEGQSISASSVDAAAMTDEGIATAAASMTEEGIAAAATAMTEEDKAAAAAFDKNKRRIEARARARKNKLVPEGLTIELCHHLCDESAHNWSFTTHENCRFLDHQQDLRAHMVVRSGEKIQSITPIFLTDRKHIILGYPHDRWHEDHDYQVGEHQTMSLLKNFLSNLKRSMKARKICLKDDTGRFVDHKKQKPRQKQKPVQKPLQKPKTEVEAKQLVSARAE